MRKSGLINKKTLPELVYGGVDGTVSTFAIVAGAQGGGLDSSIVLILGMSGLVADGFSMAVSAYLSAQTESSRSPLSDSLVTFASFVFFGGLLLVPYMIAQFFDYHPDVVFVYSLGVALLTFVVIGSLKAAGRKQKRLASAFQVTFLGATAAAIAYLFGYVVALLVV